MLKIDRINKKYKNGKGIFDISFKIENPMIVAFIGPNGSGKSTLFQTIANLIKADNGEIIFESNKLDNLNSQLISFMPDNTWLVPNFTVYQMLMYFSIMKTNKSDNDYINKIIKLMGMGNFQHQKVSSLSQGMTQKLSIACTLIGNSKIMIFDEPLNYLDIESVINFKKILRFYVKNGTYILISSHILDFLDGLADRTIFLKEGKIVKIYDNSDNQKLEEEYKSIFLK